MLASICSHCGAKIIYGKQCECKVERNRRRQKQYDKYQRNKEAFTIYHSKAWKRLVKQCKEICNGLDLYALYAEGKIRRGELVHHIEEVATNPAGAYELSNLIFVSHRSHGKIHRVYEQSEKENKKMKEFLKECLRRHGGCIEKF